MYFFPVLFDHQSMGSFVFRSASYGSFSSNQVDTIYKVEIIDLLPLAENCPTRIFKHFGFATFKENMNRDAARRNLLVDSCQNHLLNM